jgi:hypothetical protein
MCGSEVKGVNEVKDQRRERIERTKDVNRSLAANHIARLPARAVSPYRADVATR